MNEKTKKIIKLCLLLFVSISAFSKDAKYTGTDHEVKLSYNDFASPGDAIFVKMKINQTVKNKKLNIDSTEAKLEFYIDDKKTDNSNFYVLKKESGKNSICLFTGIPLSSYLESAKNYYIKIVYNLYGSKSYEFKLPFELIEKEFIHEEIPLNQKNTDIKNDYSAKRMSQIEKLNKILATVNSDNIYQNKAFSLPTQITRRTSHFADRRQYVYTNGKKSTNLHYGIDFGIPEGSEVRACGEGKVVMAEDRISTGYSVVIEHLPGLYSLYYHMSKLNVKEGDYVKQSDLIGLSGSTGLSTGPHLHWEVRLNMAAVNPDFFLTDFMFSNLN